MNTQQISWGIIGCGDVTEVKSGPAFKHVENSELVSVMRRNGELARDFAERHAVPNWTSDAYELINDPRVNAVYIATPPSSHKEYCLAAAQAGKPVYVEKPMALNHAECLDMISACQSAEVPLFVAYYRRALPKYLKIKEILAAGRIGTPRLVEIILHHQAKEIDLRGEYHWRVDPRIAGAGYFFDLGSHIFDLLQFLLGDIEQASGEHSNRRGLYAAEDQVSAGFTFENGMAGTGSFDFHAQNHVDRTEIHGDYGTISYPHFLDEDVILSTENQTESFKIPNPLHIQQPLIQTIVNEFAGLGNCPSTGKSAARTSWVMDKILGR